MAEFRVRLSTDDVVELEAANETEAEEIVKQQLAAHKLDVDSNASVVGVEDSVPPKAEPLQIKRPSFDRIRTRLEEAYRSTKRTKQYKHPRDLRIAEFCDWTHAQRHRLIDWVNDPHRTNDEIEDWVENGGHRT